MATCAVTDLDQICVALDHARTITHKLRENRGSPVLAAEHVAHLKELQSALLTTHAHTGAALGHVSQLLQNAGAEAGAVKVLSADTFTDELRLVRSLKRGTL